MSYALSREEPGGPASAVLALVVHALLFAFLFFGVRWQARQPEAVIVELWDRIPTVEPAPRAEPPPAPRPEPKVERPIEPAPSPKPEPKLQPKVAPKPPPKPDIALEREKKAPPKKLEPKVEEPPLKMDATRRIQEELAREEQELKRSQEREQAVRHFRPPSAPVMDASYAAKIRAKIRWNIVVPQNIPGNPEAEFTIVQLPTGEVLSVTLRKSSGLKVLDEAIERAILNSSPLPRPDRPEQFQRELRITYRPLD